MKKGAPKNNFELWNKIILALTTLILIILEFYALTTDSHYKWDFIFLMLLLYGLFFIRNKIDLHPFHYLLACLFLLLHDLGVFDTYSNNYFGFEYDMWVHGFFGFVASLILYRTYVLKGPYKGFFMYVAIIAVVLGFSAFHELFEYGGALAVGEGEGVLFIGAGDLDEWDTQKDMFNNLIGGLSGLGLYKLKKLFS
ncbi:MAG: hypothetical protein RL557_365 [archaeon]|jgi:uncharacterized membrane protein YjdF